MQSVVNMTSLKDECYYGLPAGIYTDEPQSFWPGREDKKLMKLMVTSKKNTSTDVNLHRELKSRVMGAGFFLWLFQSQMLTALDLICRELCWLDLAFLLVTAPTLAAYFRENLRITKKIFLQNSRESETGN